MGAVFRANDRGLQRPVAIKVLLPHRADDSHAQSQFLREGRAVANLTHENIVQVYAVGEARGIPYLVMEFVKGTTLADRLRQEAPLRLPDILRLGLDTASGLSAAHAKGFVHRDIKPANLLVEAGTGRVKIADFGLVQMAGQSRSSQLGKLIGTPYFMSPEQAEGLQPDRRSDMFSLGSVLYLACTGRLPFEGNDLLTVLRAVCESSPPPVRTLNSALPAWLEEVVAGLLTKDPARRFPTAAELRRLLLVRWARLVSGREADGGAR
jgi:serine/threonine-protein kinase